MKTYPIKSSTVVITGASSGIGKAAALLCAPEGANVVLAARPLIDSEDVFGKSQRYSEVRWKLVRT